MQIATSETGSKSRELSICVHHYTLRAPCPKGQGKSDDDSVDFDPFTMHTRENGYLRKFWANHLLRKRR